MSINSINRGPVSLPALPQLQHAPTPAAVESPAAPPQANPIQQLLNSDGFGEGGLEQLTKGLEQMVQTLSKVAELLGAQGAQGAQAPGAAGGMPAESAVPDLGGEAPVGAAPQAPVAPSAPQGAAAPAAPTEAGATAPTAKAGASKSDPKVGNTMEFKNDGTKPMEIKFTPNAGGQEIESLTLQPGESMTKQFPEGWTGNFRSTAGDGAAATLGEVAFNGGGNNTYYDVSYIEGNNAAMTIAPESGGRVSGTLDNLAAGAPESIQAKNADGSVYGIKKTTHAEVQDQSVVDYYRKNVGEAQGYVVPKDDASTLGTSDTHLKVTLKDVF